MGNLSKSDYSIFPNPTNGQVKIHLNDNVRSAMVNIYSTKGELLRSALHRGHQYTLDLSELSSGIYLTEVKTEEKTIHKRVVLY